MNSDPAAAKPSVAVDAPPGSYFVTQHTARKTTVYAIFECELESLSMFNWITGVCASIGTGLFAFGAGVWVDVAKAPEATTHPEAAAIICWLCGILAVVAYVAAGVTFCLRRSKLTAIREESEPTPIDE